MSEQAGRSRQSLMKIAMGHSVRRPEHDRVLCSDQIATGTYVAMVLRTWPIGLSRSQFWPKASLASISIDVDVVSVSTIWMPTLTLASSNVDANFSDLHALQSRISGSKLAHPLMGSYSSGHLQRLGDSWSIREGFPDLALVSTSVKNPEEGVFGGFLGLPKESFTAILDPFGVFFRGKQELGVNALDAEIPGVVGDDTLAEEAVEIDSERRQIAIESYEDRDGSFGQAARMRQGSQSRSNHDRYLCRDGPENAAYRAVAFLGTSPEFEREKGLS
ncbi:hypothetical protein Taro_003065 [Colocasia esculenta]|uniref:Uncharacterized protein n=1 Tax=Colocasia esculenta TaxID=4460 RepID=A0A843TKJ3_COLES|nr:hypothetical protein [Colocasia esculenta]